MADDGFVTNAAVRRTADVLMAAVTASVVALAVASAPALAAGWRAFAGANRCGIRDTQRSEKGTSIVDCTKTHRELADGLRGGDGADALLGHVL